MGNTISGRKDYKPTKQQQIKKRAIKLGLWVKQQVASNGVCFWGTDLLNRRKRKFLFFSFWHPVGEIGLSCVFSSSWVVVFPDSVCFSYRIILVVDSMSLCQRTDSNASTRKGNTIES
ncbi:hypothetical protein TNIN_183321 [Trichonephila inaurata madagascariensis]|uniref:Uncharacterized protein n=1 Tax=Trichonephila inaurata madagascariensis TaxID=2747483 RepID=A0A8X6YS43_9ARAC|nr:hypothetical protein TNIN_183321 [Trichonephila inaurata madagascariensis]